MNVFQKLALGLFLISVSTLSYATSCPEALTETGVIQIDTKSLENLGLKGKLTPEDILKKYPEYARVRSASKSVIVELMGDDPLKLVVKLYPAFANAPKTVKEILLDRLQHPRKYFSEIDKLQKQLQSIAIDEESASKLSDYVSEFDKLVSHPKFNRSKNGADEQSFYEAFYDLKAIHYGTEFTDWKPFEFMKKPYPEVTIVIFKLAKVVNFLKNLRNVLSGLSQHPTIAYSLRLLDATLANPKLAPILGRTEMLSVIAETPNPFIFTGELEKVERVDERDESALKYRALDRKPLEELPQWKTAKQQFEELVDPKTGLYRDFWETNVKSNPSFRKKGAVGAADRHSFLRQFPDGILKNILAPLDFNIRMAKTAKDPMYVLPTIAATGDVNLKAAFHPGIKGLAADENSKYDKKVVPFDLQFKQGQAVLLSGPNMGGKTRTAETIALLVLMAQAGLPVPAQAASLGIFNNVYVVFPEPSQVLQGEGYFGQMVGRIAGITAKAQAGDLVVLDEVPVGTDYTQQVAIKIVLIEALLQKGVTVVATGHTKKAFEILSKRSDVKVMQQSVDDEGNPTYILKPGIAVRSHGIELTAKTGFPNRVVELAKQYYKAILEHNPGLYPKTETFVKEQKVKTEEELFFDPKSTGVPEGLSKVLNKFFGVPVPRPKSDDFDYFSREENRFFSHSDLGRFLVSRLNSKGLRLTTEEKADDEAIGDLKEAAEIDYPSMDTQDPEVKLQVVDAFRDLGTSQLDRISILLRRISGTYFKLRNEVASDTGNKNLVVLLAPYSKELQQLFQIIEPTKKAAGFEKLIEYLEKKILQAQTLEKKLAAPSEQGSKEIGSNNELKTEATKFFDSGIKNIDRVLEKVDEMAGVANMALRYNLKRPKFVHTTTPTLKIKNARPLNMNPASEEVFLEDGVNQDISIDSNSPIQILTGPNSSGKSQRLTLAYLYTLMALNGYYVPADIELSEFSHVFGLFGSDSDSAADQSYFKRYLKQYEVVLGLVEPNSLVIADELQGTDNFELAAIQLAVLHYIRENNGAAIYDTHVRDGLIEAEKTLGVELRRMKVDIDAEGGLTPHYTDEPGLSQDSLGLVLAKKWITEQQYLRALEILDQLKTGKL